MHRHSGRNGSVGEEFGLRGDIGKSRGVTTVIESDIDKDLERSSIEIDGHRALGEGMWSNSASRLADVGGKEDGERTQTNWKRGIRKTTVSTQVTH
jgi:hypothetical protein